MHSFDQPMSGAELVLVAQVPKASGRWKQVHFNQAVTASFFRLTAQADRRVTLERVHRGVVYEPVARPLVFSDVNRNSKIEFDFGDQKTYPTEGVPLLLVLELDVRTFRYQLLVPGDAGYDDMLSLNRRLERVGRGFRRVVTNLDEVELAWPGCGLRSPSLGTRS